MGALQRRCCVLICSGDDSLRMRLSGLSLRLFFVAPPINVVLFEFCGAVHLQEGCNETKLKIH